MKTHKLPMLYHGRAPILTFSMTQARIAGNGYGPYDVYDTATSPIIQTFDNKGIQ